jgi:ABC-type sugar transport system permease subunit
VKHGSPGQSRFAPYLFLAPNLAVFLIFIIVPAGYNFYLSLFRTSPFRPPEFVGGTISATCSGRTTSSGARHGISSSSWSGRHPYHRLLGLIGVLLNQGIHYRGFFRSAFFYPVLLSPVVVALVWQWILNSQFGR